MLHVKIRLFVFGGYISALIMNIHGPIGSPNQGTSCGILLNMSSGAERFMFKILEKTLSETICQLKKSRLYVSIVIFLFGTEYFGTGSRNFSLDFTLPFTCLLKKYNTKLHPIKQTHCFKYA